MRVYNSVTTLSRCEVFRSFHQVKVTRYDPNLPKRLKEQEMRSNNIILQLKFGVSSNPS